MKVCIAGASGFVGMALIKELSTDSDFQVVALSRSSEHSDESGMLEWRKCDLFSLLDVENAMSGCDVAVYLVHSMLPSANLVQGSFEDFDAILADNFSRAARKNRIQHIVYLGGIVPEAKRLSAHLRSRLEVEEVLGVSGVPVTALRAGLVIGSGGSSFRLMYNLVRRLPLMLCPNWTSTLSCPVALKDVLASISFCLKNTQTRSRVYDLGTEPFVSYRSMMMHLSAKLGFKRYLLPVPFVSPFLSRLWVSLVTGAPRNLVYPLVASLTSKMLPRADHRLEIPNHKWQSPYEAIDEAVLESDLKLLPRAFRTPKTDSDKDVRSVQRIIPRKPTSAKIVAEKYFKWLPRFYTPFIKVQFDQEYIYFKFPLLRIPLLVLKYSEERSTDDRQLYYIKGGLLAYGQGRGRLEFRNVLNKAITIVAIHEFRPRLPWLIYKYTQALLHAFTMERFKQRLIKQKVSNGGGEKL